MDRARRGDAVPDPVADPGSPEHARGEVTARFDRLREETWRHVERSARRWSAVWALAGIAAGVVVIVAVAVAGYLRLATKQDVAQQGSDQARALSEHVAQGHAAELQRLQRLEGQLDVMLPLVQGMAAKMNVSPPPIASSTASPPPSPQRRTP